MTEDLKLTKKETMKLLERIEKLEQQRSWFEIELEHTKVINKIMEQESIENKKTYKFLKTVSVLWAVIGIIFLCNLLFS